MDWTQTLTIIATTVTSTYAFYLIIREDIKRHDDELKTMRDEIFKRDALWADLLKEIHSIKLFQQAQGTKQA